MERCPKAAQVEENRPAFQDMVESQHVQRESGNSWVYWEL